MTEINRPNVDLDILSAGVGPSGSTNIVTPPPLDVTTTTYFTQMAASDEYVYFETGLTTPSFYPGYFVGFPNVVAEPSQIVHAATFRVTENGNSNAMLEARGHLVDTPISDGSLFVPESSKTTAFTSAQFASTPNTEISIDVKDVVQEVIDGMGWMTGERISIYLEEDGTGGFNIFDFESGTNQASLEITLVNL